MRMLSGNEWRRILQEYQGGGAASCLGLGRLRGEMGAVVFIEYCLVVS